SFLSGMLIVVISLLIAHFFYHQPLYVSLIHYFHVNPLVLSALSAMCFFIFLNKALINKKHWYLYGIFLFLNLIFLIYCNFELSGFLMIAALSYYAVY